MITNLIETSFTGGNFPRSGTGGASLRLSRSLSLQQQIFHLEMLEKNQVKGLDFLLCLSA